MWYHNENLVTFLKQLRDNGAPTAALMQAVKDNGYAVGALEHSFRARLSEALNRFQGADEYLSSEGSAPTDEAQEGDAMDGVEEPPPAFEVACQKLAWADEKRQLAQVAAQWLRAANREQRLTEAVASGLQQWTPLPNRITPVSASPLPSRLLCLPVGDWHVGMTLDAAEGGARYAYSTQDEFYARLERWEREVHREVERERAGLAGLAVWGLGDWVENVQKRPSARTNSDVAATSEQAVIAARALVEALNRLRLAFPELPLSVEMLDGNHDMADKPGDSRPYDGWGMLIAEVVRATFAADRGVTLTYHSAPFAALRYWDTSVLLVHGNGAKGGGDNPFGGIQRMVEVWKKWHGVDFDVVCLGHFHRAASWYTTGGTKVVMNGAFSESSSFGLHLGMANPAIQKVLVIEEGSGIVYERDINLRGGRTAPTPLDARTADREGVIHSSQRAYADRQPAPSEPGPWAALQGAPRTSMTLTFQGARPR